MSSASIPDDGVQLLLPAELLQSAPVPAHEDPRTVEGMRRAIEIALSVVCRKGIPTGKNLVWAAREAYERNRAAGMPHPNYVLERYANNNGPGYRLTVRLGDPLFDYQLIGIFVFPPAVVKCLAHFVPACEVCDAAVSQPAYSSWSNDPAHERIAGVRGRRIVEERKRREARAITTVTENDLNARALERARARQQIAADKSKVPFVTMLRERAARVWAWLMELL